MRGYVPDCEVRTPGSLEEALALLAQDPGQWRALAGGTDLMVLLAAGRLSDNRFLNLASLAELKGIEVEEQAFCFGALTSFRELWEHPQVARELPNLTRGAQLSGALAIQNRGTMGGNIANASPAADTPPSLLAYGAELELTSMRGRRWVSYDRFHLGYKRMDLAPDELITRIRVPRLQGVGFHFYRKVGTRAALAISKTCLAAYARLEQGLVAELRVGLGSVAPVPLRARNAEAEVIGKPVDCLPIQAAREALQADISPIDDLRSTARYRRTVTCNMFEQMLRNMAGQG